MHEVEPKFHTSRDESLPTLGTMQGMFARVWLRKPLMPWQQRFADVAGEVLPTGLPRYRLVVLTVQRQAGKSHLEMAQVGERCFTVPDYAAWYTAQTGGHAARQFLKFDKNTVQKAPLGKVVRTLRGNGHEVMMFPNGSTYRPIPPTENAMHGEQSDRATIDEAWEFDREQGEALMQAISPTKLTRPGAQTVIISAGGTAKSTWLAELVARGRAGDPGMCYVEYGIPDDADANDLDTIARYHPAVGHTITRESLDAMRLELPSDSEWARGAGNRWTEVIGGAIPANVWESVRMPEAIPAGLPVGYGVSRAADGSQVAIVAAVQMPDTTIAVEVLDVLPTGYRAADHALGWADGDTIAVARTGSSAGLADELTRGRRNGTGVLALTETQTGAATGNLLDALPLRAIRFRTHPDLDDAVKVAALRTMGNGAKVWANAAGGSLATLEAATWAVWALTHQAPRLGAPVIRVPGETPAKV